MSNVKCPKTLQQKIEEVWNQVMNYTPTEGDYIMYAGDYIDLHINTKAIIDFLKQVSGD